MYHDNMWEAQILHRYIGLSKTETSQRQGDHASVDMYSIKHIPTHRIADRMEICVLASFILLKINWPCI